MSLKILSDQLEYLSCLKHFQQLSMVCMQKKCQTHVLICPICESNEHSGHKVASLRNFISQVKIVDDEQAVKMAIELQEQINKTKNDFQCQLQKLREQFDNSVYQLQTRMSQYFNDINQRCYDSFRKRKEQYIVDALRSSLNNAKISQLSELLQQLKQYDTLSLTQELGSYRNSTLKKLSNFTHFINKLNFKESFGSVIKLFKIIPHSFNLLYYQWSTFKATTIQINGKIATQKASNSSGERFALLQQRNGAIGDIKIQFKINKLKGWIGVGICLKKIIVSAGYKFNYTQTFHGSYLISANGYSWSHSKPEFNSAYKSFTFQQGDIISVNYSVSNATVSFENKKNSSKFELSTVPTDADDHYVPCVNICNPGDEVEIVNQI